MRKDFIYFIGIIILLYFLFFGGVKETYTINGQQYEIKHKNINLVPYLG